MTLKAQSIKATTGKLGLINIKKTSALRKTPKKEEQDKAQTGGKTSANHLCDKEIICRLKAALFAPFLFAHFCSLPIFKEPNYRNEIAG